MGDATPSTDSVDLDAIERFLGDGRVWESPYQAINQAVAYLRSLVSLARDRGIEELQGRLIEAIGRADRLEAERDALIDFCIWEIPYGELGREWWWRIAGQEDFAPTRDLAIAAVRRAAGLEEEG